MLDKSLVHEALFDDLMSDPDYFSHSRVKVLFEDEATYYVEVLTVAHEEKSGHRVSERVTLDKKASLKLIPVIREIHVSSNPSVCDLVDDMLKRHGLMIG